MSNSSLGYGDQSFQGLTNIKTIELREFTQVNTTSSTAITSLGTNVITVGSISGIAVDQVLAYDSGANQEFVTVTAISGSTFTAAFTKTHLTGVAVSCKVQRQPVIIGDPNALAALAGVTTKGVQVPYGLQTVEMTNAGRSLVTLVADNLSIASTAETLIPFTVNNGGTVTTAQTQYTVTTGKTLRIQSIIIGATNVTGGLGGATAGTTIRFRQVYSGSAIVSSPVRATVQAGTLAASTGAPFSLPLGGEIELPSGASFALTRTDSAASDITLAVTIIGYEF